jgi:DNA-binding transcriptional LysR family regulator
MRQYRYFVAVAEELSFTRAAQRLSMAQPPLSQQIAKMERDLGVRLFDRDHRRVALTAAGEALLAECYALLEQEKRAREAVASVADVKSGRLRIAAMPSLLLGLLPAVLKDFGRRLPDVEIHVEELDDADQLERLAQQRIDVGLGRLSRPVDGFTVTDLGSEAVLAALPKDHPLAERRLVRLADLASDGFIMFRRSQAPDVYDAYIRACIAAGFQMRIADDRAVGDHSILGLVACGQGVALVPMTTSHVRVLGVTYRPLEPLPEATVHLSLCWRTRAVPRFAGEFASAVRRQVQALHQSK